MAYTLPAAADYNVDSPINATLMSRIVNNPDGIAAGDGGRKIVAAAIVTGTITQNELGANSVGQSELKDATGAQSIAVPSNSSQSISLTGSTFALWTISATAGNGANDGDSIGFGSGNSSAGVLGFYSSANITRTVYVDQRYFTSSAPYETSDGRMHLFVYVKIKKGSNPIEIEGISVAPAPIWAYHGPTSITPDTKKDVKGVIKNYKIVKAICAENGGQQGLCDKIIKLMKNGDSKSLDKIIKRSFDPDEPFEEIEITTDYKNSDMEVAPHPWFTNSKEFLKDSEIVLLDPQSTEALLLLHNQGMDLLPLVENGTIKIDNTRLKRAVPSSVMACGFKL